MIDFFTIGRVICLIGWAGMVILYLKSYNRHKKEIYQALKGDDGKWNAVELASWYWFKFFPMLFLITLLMVIVQIELTDSTENLMITIWTATNGIFAVTIAGKAWGNGKKDNNSGRMGDNIQE